jgi:hypothetical protein
VLDRPIKARDDDDDYNYDYDYAVGCTTGL